MWTNSEYIAGAGGCGIKPVMFKKKKNVAHSNDVKVQFFHKKNYLSKSRSTHFLNTLKVLVIQKMYSSKCNLLLPTSAPNKRVLVEC